MLQKYVKMEVVELQQTGQFTEKHIGRKGAIHLVLLVEILRVVASVLLIISAGFYLRHLEKTKSQRKLTSLELIMYFTIQFAFILFAISLLIAVFS